MLTHKLGRVTGKFRINALSRNYVSMLYLFYLYNFANIFRHNKYMRSCLSNQVVLLSSKDMPDFVDY
jgi:hypothetical protein